MQWSPCVCGPLHCGNLLLSGIRSVLAGNMHRDMRPAAHLLQHSPSLERAADVGLNSPVKLMSLRLMRLDERADTACTDSGLLMNITKVLLVYLTVLTGMSDLGSNCS